jgi:hypothetical protein
MSKHRRWIDPTTGDPVVGHSRTARVWAEPEVWVAGPGRRAGGHARPRLGLRAAHRAGLVLRTLMLGMLVSAALMFGKVRELS